jgi:hypothetical protein
MPQPALFTRLAALLGGGAEIQAQVIARGLLARAG